jgi:DeoR family transcriptional regulator of aga operon
MSGMPLSRGEQRREAIMRLLKEKGRISVHDIVETQRCSVATARRDLDLLEQTAPIIRTIGGAIYDGFNASREISFHEKTSISWIEKERIAEKAASLVREGDIIGLSGGTTTYLIARALKRRSGITVVTNAVNIAMELAGNDGIQVVVAGGIMRHKSYELCGPLTEKVVESLNIGKMFLGIDGLSVAHGLTTYSEGEAQIAKILIKRSNKTFVVFDRSKVGRVSLFSIAPLSVAHAFITDAPLDRELQAECDKWNVHVYVADREEHK